MAHLRTMSDWTRRLRIANERPLRADRIALVFSAEDDIGQLEVWVPAEIWESLQADAPLPCDGDDRRDYALCMIEVRAAEQPPQMTAAGIRIVLVA